MNYDVLSIEQYDPAMLKMMLNTASTQGWTLFDIIPYGFNNVSLMLVFTKPKTSTTGGLTINLGL